MESAQLASEWTKMKSDLKTAEENLKSYRKQLNEFRELRSTMILLNEMDKFKKRRKINRQIINELNSLAQKNAALCEKIKEVLPNSRAWDDIVSEIYQNLVDYRTVAERYNAPADVIGDIEAVKINVQHNPETAIEWFRASVEETLRQFELAIRWSDEIIGAINSMYDFAREGWALTIEHAEELIALRRQIMAAWAGHDEERLRWIEKNEPPFADDARKLLTKKRQSGENAAIVPKKSFRPYIRIRENPVIAKQAPLPEEAPWKFVFCHDDATNGIHVSRKRSKFIDAIKQLLKKRALRGLNAGTLYARLTGVTQMNMNDRQRMDQIYGNGKFHGWKKINVGDFRILLMIDEQEKIIYFSPQPHEVYQRIYRG